jgi:transketolase
MPSPDLSPRTLRRHILDMAYAGQTVHSPCALSLVDILSVLYRKHLRYNPADPRDPQRDLLVLSKGHGVMAAYACFREIGWLDQADLDHYQEDGTKLHGLAETKVPGLEATTGSLGHGLAIAAGMAFALKRQGRERTKVVCVVGDGEINEGPNWEALLFAAHQKLDNLTLIVDANEFQAMGTTAEILGLEPLPQKLGSFGCHAMECDGHDQEALDLALSAPNHGLPKAIVARTIKGKGVAFMERDNRWHYTRMDEADYRRALQQSEAAHA